MSTRTKNIPDVPTFAALRKRRKELISIDKSIGHTLKGYIDKARKSKAPTNIFNRDAAAEARMDKWYNDELRREIHQIVITSNHLTFRIRELTFIKPNSKAKPTKAYQLIVEFSGNENVGECLFLDYVPCFYALENYNHLFVKNLSKAPAVVRRLSMQQHLNMWANYQNAARVYMEDLKLLKIDKLIVS